MSTVNFAPGTEIEVKGKKYTTQTGINVTDNTESRQTEDGIKRFDSDGNEVDENGEKVHRNILTGKKTK